MCTELGGVTRVVAAMNVCWNRQLGSIERCIPSKKRMQKRKNRKSEPQYKRIREKWKYINWKKNVIYKFKIINWPTEVSNYWIQWLGISLKDFLSNVGEHLEKNIQSSTPKEVSLQKVFWILVFFFWKIWLFYCLQRVTNGS